MGCIFRQTIFNHHVRHVSTGQTFHPKDLAWREIIMAKTGKKAPTKTEVLQNIANATDLTKKQVAAVLDALTEEIRKGPRPPRRRRLHASGSAEDREEEGPRSPGPEGREEPVHRRIARSSRQAGLQQGQGSGVARLEGHGYASSPDQDRARCDAHAAGACLTASDRCQCRRLGGSPHGHIRQHLGQ